MEKNIKVTVCVAIYNVEQYLKECLDSLHKQTLKEAEFILVDDGSTDNSSAICDLYSKLDRRFVVIHHEKNKGLLMARKSGALAANGDYVLFLDGDDYYASEKTLKELYSCALYSSCEVVRFSHQVYNGAKTRNIKIEKDLLEKNIVVSMRLG